MCYIEDKFKVTRIGRFAIKLTLGGVKGGLGVQGFPGLVQSFSFVRGIMGKFPGEKLWPQAA